MASYNNTVSADNNWGSNTIVSLWVSYYNRNISTKYADKIGINLAHEGKVQNVLSITSYDNCEDYWSVSVLLDNNELWSSDYQQAATIPHQSGDIEINIVSPASGETWGTASFIFPNGKSKGIKLNRL
ncbi:MAG: hypothetical protein ACRC3B_11460 [Bacteroidia bacterium]